MRYFWVVRAFKRELLLLKVNRQILGHFVSYPVSSSFPFVSDMYSLVGGERSTTETSKALFCLFAQHTTQTRNYTRRE